jgi:hypothetical protein
VTELEGRLGAILAPRGPQEVPKNPPAAPSSLASYLHVILDEIAEVASSVDDIRSRLEL